MTMTMRKNNLKYYFRDESVVLEYNKQFISFNCFSLQSRRKFKRFSKVLQDSGKTEYANINDIYGLASKYGIRPTSGHKPTIVKTIAF